MAEAGRAVQELVKEVTGPLDLAFGAAGAAITAGVSLATQGSVSLALMLAGIWAGLAIRKSLAVSFRRRGLRKRAAMLRAELEIHIGMEKLIQALDFEASLWEKRLTSHDGFEGRMDKILDGLREAVAVRSAVPADDSDRDRQRPRPCQ